MNRLQVAADASLLVQAGAMTVLALHIGGALVAPFLVDARGNPKWFDSTAGAFTFYLVFTGWMTVKRKAGTLGRAEIAAFAFAVLLGAWILLLGTRTHGGGKAYYVLGALIWLAAALDLKVILKRGISGTQRIARHLWRMSLGLFVATGSFFLGQQRVMSESIQGSPVLLVLGFSPLAAMLFWLVRVRFGPRLRRALAGLHRPDVPRTAEP